MRVKRTFDVKWILILGIIAFLLVFQVFPIVYMTAVTLFPGGRFSPEALRRIYSYRLNLVSLENTLITSTLAMIFGVIIATPLAWLVTRTNLYGRRLFRSVFAMTYMVPPYVGAMAWLKLLNPTVGTLNVFLRDLFHLGGMPFNIYSTGGLVWVLATFYYPYAFIIITRSMERIDTSLEEASRISGASGIRTFFTVTLPLVMPSIVSSALLVFVAAASCYGIPSIIGSPAKIYTVTTRIVDYVYIGSKDGLDNASSLAVFLMVLSLLLLYLSEFATRRRDFVTIRGKSTQSSTVDLGRWRLIVTIAVAVFATVIIVIPFASVFATSFTMDMGRSVFSPGNFTTKYWSVIASRRSIITSVKNSLLSAVMAATFGMLICFIMAYLKKRMNVRGRSIPDFLIALGSGSPSVVIALALIMTMSGRFGINIYNTLAIMVIAYMIKYMMMGMRTVVAAMSQVSSDLEEAAQSNGAGWLRRLRDILVPIIAPSVVAGWFLIFMPCFYELSMSNLLYSNNTKTLGVDLFLYQTYHSQQTAAALAGGILILVTAVNLLLYKLTKGKFNI